MCELITLITHLHILYFHSWLCAFQLDYYDQHGLLLFEINISYKYILSGLASFYDLGFVPFQPCVQAQMFG